MTQRTIAPPPVRRLPVSLLLALVALAVTMLTPACRAQAQPASRIASPIDLSARVPLKGSVSPRIAAAADQGRVSGNLKLDGLTLVFTPTSAQQADLKQLLVDQQTPGSSSYHAWLTPAQYAARFGMSEADLAKVAEWLTSQGFTVAGPNNSRTRITFSGNAAQVESAFATELHHYSVNGETHLANATAIQVPAALSGIAGSVGNISDFRPRPRMHPISPQYTSSPGGPISVTPGDLDVIYDIAPLYAAGYNGTGQKLAIVGQSEVALADIANFRSAAGLAAKAPIPVLVPGTGSSKINPQVDGDESESDIDLEYSGAIAQNANIYFVYTGESTNYSVFDALQYAVDTDIAPVISISYGTCEANLETGEFAALETVFAQANSQGQTIFSAAGDTGATDCDDTGTPTTPTTAATHGLAVDYPAASQYVTGVGGTMFNDATSTSTYWATTNTSIAGSALSYIPEEAWNETLVSIMTVNGVQGSLLGGGGGASTLTAKPSWQTGTGVPNDGHRDVPDISLDAAVYHEPYLYCSSDSTSTGITGSCTTGFLDANDQYFTAAGGTSFAAPIAAGMLTLVNQKTASTGQGNLNPTLYSIAASTPAAFHDITVGNNSQPCTVGSTGCTSSPIGFSAGVGYDQATGLGTLDLAVLAGAFAPTTTGSLIPTTITLSPADSSITAGTATTITATVTGNTGTGTPTGTVQFSVDGTNSGAAVPLTGSVATFAVPTATLAALSGHVIKATYSGDTTYATSYATDTLNVAAAPSTGVGTFALTSTAATAPLGGTATSTITVTPAAGYAGTVSLGLTSGSTATTNALGSDFCYDLASGVAVPNTTTPASTTLTLYTTLAACNGTVSPAGRPLHKLAGRSASKTVASTGKGEQKPGFPELPVSAAAVAGAVCLLASRRRSRVFSRIWMLGAVVLLSGVAMGSIGCGGSSGSTAIVPQQVPAGTYSLVVTGTDSLYSSIPAASTTITFTVQ